MCGFGCCVRHCHLFFTTLSLRECRPSVRSHPPSSHPPSSCPEAHHPPGMKTVAGCTQIRNLFYCTTRKGREGETERRRNGQNLTAINSFTAAARCPGEGGRCMPGSYISTGKAEARCGAHHHRWIWCLRNSAWVIRRNTQSMHTPWPLGAATRRAGCLACSAWQ